MNLETAHRLQKLMPWKKIFYDTVYKCYRLLNNWYEYQDEEGRWRERPNRETLIPLNSY